MDLFVDIPRLRSVRLGLFNDIRNETYFTPLQSFMILYRPINPKCETSEPPKVGYNQEGRDSEDNPLCPLNQPSAREDEMVHKVRKHQDREVKSWELETNSCVT